MGVFREPLTLRFGTILSIIGLVGCAHPVPGENSAASASQADSSVTLATRPTAGQEVSAVAANRLEIVFRNGNADLTGAAAGQLDVAARLFRDVNPVLMFVSGHTDTVGDEYSNLLLSARRAQSVKEGLVARGIPADRLLLQALGTSDPVNASDPQAAINRRVTVTWRVL